MTHLKPLDRYNLASTRRSVATALEMCTPSCAAVTHVPFGIYSVRARLKPFLTAIGATTGNQTIVYKAKGYHIEYPVGRQINEFSKFAEQLSGRHNFVLHAGLMVCGYAE